MRLRGRRSVEETAKSAKNDVIAAGFKRNSRPLVWTATIAECIAAASTIYSKLPPWLASAVLVGIPLGALSWYQWYRARDLADQVRQLYNFDRKYVRFLTRWTLRKSEVSGYFAGTYHGERDLVALRPIRKLEWNISRRSDDDMPFSVYPPTLYNQRISRTGDGVCKFNSPHKLEANFTFRIEFDSMLRPGERVSVSYDVDVPVFKAGTLERLRRRPMALIQAPRDSDYSSTDVSYPMEEFIKEVLILESLGTTRHGLQVLQ